MENILHDVYYGRLHGYERQHHRTNEIKAVNEKIRSEREYFEDKMTDDDVQRFRTLEELYTQASGSDEMDSFLYGFRMGVKLMCAVFAEGKTKH